MDTKPKPTKEAPEPAELASDKPKTEFPPKKTFWRIPPTSERNSPVLPEVLARRLAGFKGSNTDSMVAMWKELPTAAKERIFIGLHFGIPLNTGYRWWYSCELLWILRRVFVEIDWKTQVGEDKLRRAFDALEAITCIGEKNVALERKWFGEIGLNSSLKWAVGAESHDLRVCLAAKQDLAKLRLVARQQCMKVYDWAMKYCKYSQVLHDPARGLRKIGVTPHRYSTEDRQRIVDVLDGTAGRDRLAKGDGRSSYLERLFDSVGKEPFEYFMFGKVKICGTCGGSNRQKALLCCKPCAKEGVHPKRRYCGEECQRADWLEHRKFHLALGHKLGGKKSEN